MSNNKKLEVIKRYETHGIKSTLQRFFSHVTKQKTSENQVYQWKQNRAIIEESCKTARTAVKKKNRSSGVATSLPTAAELELVEWVNELRNEGVPVTSVMLQLQALEIAKEYHVDKFAASPSWQKLFRKRHRLSLRCRTRQGQIAPDDANKIAADFAVRIKSKMAELGVSKVYNADQTAVFYEYLPKKTLNKRSEKTVWVRGGGKEKQRLTAILLTDSNGTKYPPMLVYKCSPFTVPAMALENKCERNGFSVGMWQEMEPVQTSTGMPIHCNAKGWFNSELAMIFLRHYFGNRGNRDEPILLLWDDFSGHWSPHMQKT
ncbi:hypothetical protein PR001_g21081 [Phytophthora rubi]|uniref:HTH CENPB-type domain-containing protein n=1 Tax=Phytophthora rubi TaxID=129364 RepID=A0A6A3JCM3_9STRA|nr:hypothetical protein PR001_g21081 [Phytophthora rubi]